MTHIFGLATVLLASLWAGAQLVLRPQFDSRAAGRAGAPRRDAQPRARRRCSRACWGTARAGHGAPRRRRRCYVYTGAGPLDLTLKHRVEATFGQALHHGYGLSEYAGSVHLTRMGEQRSDTSVGYVVEDAEVQVTDRPRAGATNGRARRAVDTGRGLMRGWFVTGRHRRGDEGGRLVRQRRPGRALHADGALFVVGRLKR